MSDRHPVEPAPGPAPGTGTGPASAPAIRRLGPADLPACTRLARDRDWAPEEHKWGLLFDVGVVHGVDAPDGDGLAGAVVATPYGREVAAVSMMLVARRYERRGLGGRLMRHALEHSGTAGAVLTATDYGRPLYERLGFRTVGSCTTYGGRARVQESRGAAGGEARKGGGADPRGGPGEEGRRGGLAAFGDGRDGRGDGCAVSRAYAPGDRAAVHALDAEVFGARRTALLDRLPDFCERFLVAAGPEATAGIAGFGGAWRNGDETVIGPVTAQDTATALALIGELAAAAVTDVRLDLDHRQPEVVAWAERQGLEPRSTTAVMVHGEPAGGDPRRLFTPVMQALG